MRLYSWRGCLHTSRQARISIEQLESRQLLSSSNPTAADLVSQGLAPIRWKGEHTFAAPGQWLAILDRKPGSTRHQIQKINDVLAGTGIRAVRRLNADKIFLFRGPQQAIDQVKAKLARLPGFVSVEPDTIRTVQSVPNDARFTEQWGLSQPSDADIDAPEAWNLTTGTNTVVTAVVDSGIDYTHPDLAANIYSNPNEIANNGIDDDGNGFIDDTRGWDFANGDKDPMDDNSHGTGVAGTIGAVGNNGIGTTGVAWQTKLLPLKFISDNGVGYTSNAVAAISYAANLKSRGVNIKVINNSWNGGYSVSLSLVIDQLNAQGVLFVVAAGNEAKDNDVSPAWPANMTQSNVISVAATDQNDQLAVFSSTVPNYGSNYGANTVDLAAPGVGILTTSLLASNGWGTGTSDSAPFVSGAAALAFAYAPNATAAQVKAALLNGADRLPSLAGKCVSGGRLNVFNALSILAAPTSGTGVQASYYDNKDFTGATVAANVSQVNFNWGTGSPSGIIGNDTFSARFTGYVQPQYAETYTFYTLADDGVRVYVNNQLIINRWSNHPGQGDFDGNGIVNALDFGKLASIYASGGTAAAPYDLNVDGVINSVDFSILASNFGKTVSPIMDSGTIALQANTLYPITVEYFENYSAASLKLSWSSPSTAKQAIPTARLYPPGTTVAGASAAASLFASNPIADHKDEPVI